MEIDPDFNRSVYHCPKCNVKRRVPCANLTLIEVDGRQYKVCYTCFQEGPSDNKPPKPTKKVVIASLGNFI
jgi:hypothetical protein